MTRLHLYPLSFEQYAFDQSPQWVRYPRSSQSLRRMTMSNEKLISLFQSFLFRNYGCSLDDVEPTDVKGYWRKKQACDPKTCRSQIHNCMFNEGPINHTIYYTDLVRNNGRFTSPFQTWNLMRERA